DLERLGDKVLVHRLDVADKELGARIGHGMVDASRDVDHQALGTDSLRDRLAADQGLMRGGDVELRGADEVGEPKLAENRGPRRRKPALGIEISDNHMTSPCWCRLRTVAGRIAPREPDTKN